MYNIRYQNETSIPIEAITHRTNKRKKPRFFFEEKESLAYSHTFIIDIFIVGVIIFCLLCFIFRET